MSLDEAIEYFGNLYKVCLALGIAPQNMTKWKKQNYIPYLQQHRLAVITEGDLLPDEIDPHVNPRSKKKPVQLGQI
jgi:hypothetical protein